MSPERFRREIRKLAPEADPEPLFLLATLLREMAYPLGLIGEAREDLLRERHLLDSARLVPYLSSGPVADLGSGAGLPGLVLAVLRPDLEIWLIEPRRKAVSFLEYARAKLGLERVKILRARAEDPEVPRGYFHTVTARAVAELARLWEYAAPLLLPQGYLLALKGPRAPQEIRNLKDLHPELQGQAFRYPLSGKGTGFVVKIQRADS